MAVSDKSNSLLLSDTLVPDLFIYQHMINLTKEAIVIYMIMISGGKSSYSEKSIVEASLMDKNTTTAAISELISSGILSKDSKGDFVLVDLKKIEVDSYCSALIARGGADLNDLELSPLHAERESLCDSISKSIYGGKMGYIFYRIVDKCLFEYGFETFVIYSLFDIAKERKIQYNYKDVEKLAAEWHKKGIKDSESLNVVFENESKTKEIVKLVGRLTRTRVDGLDMEKIEKWVSLGLSVELIELAFRSNKYRDSLRTKDVDDTLSNWLANGITTTDAAVLYEEEQHKENKRKYTKRKNSDPSYRTGKDAGLTVAPSDDNSKAGETVPAPADDDAVNDILNLFGDDENEDD